MSLPSSSLVFHNVARHTLTSRASNSCVSATGHVARRFFASSHSVLASKVDDASGSGIVNLGARSAGRIAAKDENGNAIGRESGPLYREWLESDGAAFKDPRPHETNYLGGRVVSYISVLSSQIEYHQSTYILSLAFPPQPFVQTPSATL